MTGRVAHGRPFIFWFQDLARQRHIQEPASLPESFILESSSKDCLKNDRLAAGALAMRRNWNRTWRTVTVLPMRILRLRRAAHLHLTLQRPASRMPRDRAFGVCESVFI